MLTGSQIPLAPLLKRLKVCDDSIKWVGHRRCSRATYEADPNSYGLEWLLHVSRREPSAALALIDRIGRDRRGWPWTSGDDADAIRACVPYERFEKLLLKYLEKDPC